MLVQLGDGERIGSAFASAARALAEGGEDDLALGARQPGGEGGILFGNGLRREIDVNLSLRLAVQSQLASQSLLITEEAGLGGTGFLRGYDWAERTGDQAAMGMAELRYLINRPFGAIRRAQLYAFVDGGKVTNLDGGFGSGALASAGGGMRADITSTLGANLELAVPLSGPRYDTGDESSKLNFRIIKSF